MYSVVYNSCTGTRTKNKMDPHWPKIPIPPPSTKSLFRKDPEGDKRAGRQASKQAKEIRDTPALAVQGREQRTVVTTHRQLPSSVHSVHYTVV